MDPILYLIIGAAAGAAIGFIIAHLRAGAAAAALAERSRGADEARARAEQSLQIERLERSKAEADRAAALAKAAEKEAGTTRLLEDINNSREALKNSFSALSQTALEGASTSFLKLATEKFKTTAEIADSQLAARKKEVESLVSPIREKLTEIANATKELEIKREGAYASLHRQLTDMASHTQLLRDSTKELATSLRGSSQARGRWGEVQLKNLVELAGMVNHCDFDEQTGLADGGRPDLVVHLPGDRMIPIDAKAPLAAYLDACAATDSATRATFLKSHAEAIRNHIKTLASRDYPEKLETGVGFVVLFLPGDAYLSAAFESDGDLFEIAVKKGVFLATPVTLLVLLRTAALYWQQTSIADNARAIADVAAELYNRVVNFYEPFHDAGRELEKAVKGYNKAVGSFEGRILPFARQLEKLGPSDQAKKLLPEPAPIETAVRFPQSPGASADA
ncbi:MAG: DNA recombination protein RmuC [Planctomycetes bacterium]|nr:DNA recombination protein RmuC [Planctomycetota bacterium]